MSHPESDGTPRYDPASGELLGHSPLTTSDELAAIVERARMAQPALAEHIMSGVAGKPE